jgi:hypothetical protein
MPGRVLHEVLWSAGRPRGAFSFRAESGGTQASCLSRQPGIPAWVGTGRLGSLHYLSDWKPELRPLQSTGITS